MYAEQFAYQSAGAALAGGAGCARPAAGRVHRAAPGGELLRRGGAGDNKARQRIEVASEPELDRWLEQTIIAENLDSIFR